MSGVLKVTSSIQLYKHLIRCVKTLPPEAQGYYSNYVRQGYSSHNDEDEPERIKQIISRAVNDAEWILQKYTKPSTGTSKGES